MIQLKDIVYEASGKRILDGVSLEITKPFTVITGPNGSGKSTIARIIAGIIKPTSGRIVMDGADITDMSITDRAKAGIGFAFQQPVKFKGLSVKDLISVAAGKTVTTAQACSYLADVGLCAKEYVSREVDASLSGGELKRIEIATVLARSARLSVFDEPEAGIDLWSFNNLIRVFETLQKKNSGNIMIISHQERILAIADEILVLRAGKIDAKGSADEIMPKLGNMVGLCPVAGGNA